MRDLLADPIWRPDELGLPIPPSPHAVSVALPRWRDVIGYEEKWPEVISRLQAGYPRFVIHKWVAALAERLAPGSRCLPFPSERVARSCADYVASTSGTKPTIVSALGVRGVVVAPEGAAALKAFWQHTGLIVSSRQAEAALAGHAPVPDFEQPRQVLRERIAAFYRCAAEDVFLFPTGVAALFTALKAARARSPGLATAQIGFPYVDTLKMQEQFGTGVLFAADVSTAIEELETKTAKQPLAACCCELPTNPLLQSVDLPRLSTWLRARRTPLIVDDAVATPFNVDLSACADMVATSLTKFIAGSADVMGGALVLGRHSPLYAELRSALLSVHEELLWPQDAAVLADHARGYTARMPAHNAGGLFLAERLRAHPKVAKVWYPRWESAQAYEAVRRPEGGYGGLLSFLPHDPERQAPRIYDALEVCKGPTLGTSFTIVCPFTLLAHYGELDWAEGCGVSRYLIRVSVGIEEPQELWRRFEKALAG